MAEPSLPDLFATKIGELSIQNASVDAVLDTNRQFNDKVKIDLQEINENIKRINEKIRDLMMKLAETQAQVAENEVKITQNTADSANLASQLNEITAQREQASAQLEENQRNIAELQAAADEKQRQYTADLARLNAEKEAERLAMNEASEQNKETIQMQIKDTESQIAALKKKHQDELNKSGFEIAQLKAIKDEIKDELEKSNIKIIGFTEQVRELSERNRELIVQNANLNEILKNAIPIIDDAKNKLAMLSDNSTDQGEINRLINEINISLGEINVLLEISSIPSAAAPGSFSQENPMNQTRVLPGMNISRRQVFTPNPPNPNVEIDGTEYTKDQIFKKLREYKDIGIFSDEYNNDFNKIQNKVFSIVRYRTNIRLDNSGDNAKKIENLISILTPLEQGNTIKDVLELTIGVSNLQRLFSEPPTGGKRIRKTRKTKKIRRKTRRRKTKKVQRGGYHYNERARRKSITTTSSKRTSKRISRRNKRTTSI